MNYQIRYFSDMSTYYDTAYKWRCLIPEHPAKLAEFGIYYRGC